MSQPIFDDPVWQMSWGERAAMEGVLSQIRPGLAIEIGSMEGACLRRIAAHAQEVHSFDLVAPSLSQPANVTLHTGDSHELLPTFLAELAEAGRNVDFVLVDGDHTPDGVRRDLEDLLDSPATHQTTILIHDTANERVRQGVEAVRFAAWPKVARVDLDWVPGRLFAEPELRGELWYGLGLVRVDHEHPAYGEPVYEDRYHPTAPLLVHARELLIDQERYALAGGAGGASIQRLHELNLDLAQSGRRAAELEAELQPLRARVERAERVLRDVQTSASWRVTAPLRSAKRRVHREL